MASHQLNPLNLLTAGLQKSWLQGWCFREDEVLHQNELRQSPRCSLCISSVSFGLSPQNPLITLNCRSAAGDEVARKPKLFFVSTSSTTTTLQTASLCYATSGTSIGTCTGRKRRSINIEGVPLAAVQPSQLNQEVQSSQEDQLDREGRFLLYWITTTSISTSTSYTTTIKISAATCTPAVNIGWGICWYSTRLIMLFLFVLFDWYIFWNPWHISLFLLIYSLFNVGPANIDREFYKGCLFGYQSR